MAVLLNEDLVLWCASVVQPATAAEIGAYVKLLFPEAGRSLENDTLSSALQSLECRKLLVCVHKKAGLYSASAKCNRRLSKNLRRARDSARLFLMWRSSAGSFKRSGESIREELDGDSPPTDERLAIEGAARPINPAAELRATQLSGRIYRPRIIKQLDFPVGSEIESPDLALRYGSFATLRQIREASGEAVVKEDLSLDDLALCIGVTPALLRSMILWKLRYYRSFSIRKRSGGERRIDAPRVYLKAIQQWIADNLLWRLPVHDACHSYRRGRSILTNSKPHIGHKFVACVDIEDFFGSVRKQQLLGTLTSAQLWPELSSHIAALCTLRGSLPQGAPTSPILSNAYLFDFDQRVEIFAAERAVTYTRYADDITLSGDSKGHVQDSISYVSRSLQEFRLHIRADKTRLISKQGQQRVTGIVVNEAGYPPRRFRRQVRAGFHKLQNRQSASMEEYRRLRGLLSYLQQFKKLRESEELRRYALLLSQVAVREDGDV